MNADSLRTAAAAVARKAVAFGGTIAWLLDDSLPLEPAEQARAVADGVILGSYDPGRWKTQRPKRREIERVVLVTGADLATDADRAGRVATWTNRARDLSNMPANELTPERLAEVAQVISTDVSGLTVEAFGLERARELGMGAFSGVAQGARNPAQMIVMRYEPEEAPADVVLGLVGKAITFDTGGISIKPSEHMEEMKHDMSGGAAVVAAMGAIADLGLPVRTIAVVAASENMPDGGAYRPGDILTASNGKTIEVISTDAEGRLVLADALVYARAQGATHVLDLATLTGAMVVALGDIYAGVFSNDEDWTERIVAAGVSDRRRGLAHADGSALPPDDRLDVRRHAEHRQVPHGRRAGRRRAAQGVRGRGAVGAPRHRRPGLAALRARRLPSQPGGTGYGVRLIVQLASSLAA